MSDAFSYKKGMRLPSRIITLAGNGVTNLATLTGIVFVYRKKGVVERHTITPTIVGAMQLEVDFGSVDTATVAQYEWQVEATLGGNVMAFPERGFYTFSVTDTIA